MRASESLRCDINSILKKGIDLKTGGDYYKAIVEFKRALQICETAEVHYQIADTCLCDNRREEAICSFKKAIDVDILFINAYKCLGGLYINEGNYSEAAEYLSKAMRIAPSDNKVQIALGNSYLKLGLWEKAEKIYKKAFDLDPNSFEAASGLCEAYINNDKEHRALELIHKTQESGQVIIDFYNRLGIVYRKRGDYINAISNYIKAIEIDPFQENLHFNIAKAYYKAGDKNKAIEELRKTLEIRPDFHEAQKFLNEYLDQ